MPPDIVPVISTFSFTCRLRSTPDPAISRYSVIAAMLPLSLRADVVELVEPVLDPVDPVEAEPPFRFAFAPPVVGFADRSTFVNLYIAWVDPWVDAPAVPLGRALVSLCTHPTSVIVRLPPPLVVAPDCEVLDEVDDGVVPEAPVVVEDCAPTVNPRAATAANVVAVQIFKFMFAFSFS